MTAWPLPREISHRFTGNATQNATTKDSVKLTQNKAVSKPACIALGTAKINALSAISMDKIERVSATKANFNARRKVMP